MFNIGDVVIYGAQGICKIDGLETRQMGKNTMQYYVLKPLFDENTAVFVPVKNENLTSKMKNILTKDKVKELIKKISVIDIIKANDKAQKREEYKSVLLSGDRERLVSLIKTIRYERDIRRQNNKKLNVNDEQTLRKAELLLYNELGFVLQVDPGEVKNIIKF